MQTEMRFTLIGPTYPYRGGIAHHTSLLYHHLSQRHRVQLISFKRQYPRWLVSGRDQRDPSGSPMVPAECEYLLDPVNPLTWEATYRRVRRIRPHLVVIQWWVPFWAPCFAYVAYRLRRAGNSVVYLCHNVLPHEQRRWDRPLARMALRQAHSIIVQAQSEGQRLREMLPNMQLRVVPLPIYDMFPDRSGRQGARHHLGFMPDDRVLLFFGFVRRYKGLDVLIEALGRLRGTRVHLLVCGEFWEDEGAYRSRIRDLGLADVVRLENRYIPDEELSLYFAAADALVAPYRSASQSAVVQMAYGFGRPVIASNVGAMSEVVEHEVTGLLVPPEDPAALARAIKRFYSDGLAPRLVQGVIEQRARFSWDAMVDALQSCAADVMSKEL